MAIVTLYRSVRAKQGEAVLVVLQLLRGNVPPLNRVALRAIRSHFSLVHVGMTVLTVSSHVGEHWFRVTQGALNLCVHAAKRVLGFIVVKFRHRANWTPARRGVTVLTRDRKRPVRAPSRLPLRSGNSGVSRPQEKEPAQDLNQDRRNCLQRYRLLDTSPSSWRAVQSG